ncbi:MAG: ArnT family glycosyltransferase, partial [Omnitrophica WOR_2 bacterium]
MARRVNESLRKYRFIDRMINFEASAWAETALVIGLAFLALIVQGVNMLHYPTLGRLGDEGIYMSQAWAVLREGRLAPYTYWYDHAPAGWILIAGWMGLLGGPHAFGAAIDTGRALMLLLHLGAVLMLYFLSRRLGISAPLAGLASFLLSVSPLAITYQRMVLLDNIMIFWILLSLILLVGGKGRLERLFISGIVFGVAILSKEPAIFLLPAMLYIAYRERGRQAGWLSLGSWFIPMLAVVSLYPLYALLRGELLPLSIGGQPLSSTSGVYLVNSAIWQSGRGGGGSIFNPGSMFWQNVRVNWAPVDPFLIVGGITAVIANLVRGLRDRRFLAAGLLGFLPFLYLARGGLVYDFYIVFALPFFCLNLALL